MSTLTARSSDHVSVFWTATWQTYERLLAERGDDARPRLVFDRGVLEIMSPSKRHESLADLVRMVVTVLSEEWDVDVAGLGSTTFKEAAWNRGFEPDGCFYVGPAAERVRRLERVDPRSDPVPDVVVEIDLSRDSTPKHGVFAQFGVTEVWRHDGRRMAFLALDGDRYAPVAASRAFPGLTADALTRLLERGGATSSPGWLGSVRAWARDAVAPDA